MGYVLINGQRYYKDAEGSLTLDNATQAEADLRERRSATPPAVGTTGSPLLMLKILILVVFLLIGAWVHNLNSDSPAERAIREYMDRTAESSAVQQPAGEASADEQQ